MNDFSLTRPFFKTQSGIKDAAETANKKQAQKASALSVNSISIQSTPKRTERTTAFSEATDSLGEQIKAARDRKAAEVKPEAKRDKASGS